MPRICRATPAASTAPFTVILTTVVSVRTEPDLENADARYPHGLVEVDEDGDGLLDAAETEHLWQALERAVEINPRLQP